MNYRHAFHAGNFADLVKHAALLAVLDRLMSSSAPVTVIDTHAGRGVYDLGGPEAQRSGEAAAGIGRLMTAADLPEAFAPLRAAVARLNPGGSVRTYPGSPTLVADRLRPGDTYVACELRPEEHRALSKVLAGRPGVKTACVDGYERAVADLPAKGPALVLIDPPFERSDDYDLCARALGRLLRRNRDAWVMIWLPIKDLETFDAFLRAAEDEAREALTVAEARMRPLSDPMKMNGCALVLARCPADLSPVLEAVCNWTVTALGQEGRASVWTTG